MIQLTLTATIFMCLLILLGVSPVIADQFDQDFSGQKIIVGGTGDSQKLLRAVARALEKKLQGGSIDIPDTIGSTGGIKALVAGRVDLARIARPILPNEKKHKLTYLLFAKNPVVFVTHPSVSKINNLKHQQVLSIYSGDISNWIKVGDKDHKIYPVTREPGDASIKILNKYLPNFNVNNKVVKTLFSNPATIEAITKHEHTIGYLPLSNVKGTNLRVMKLDGIFPSPDNIQKGRYKLAMPLAIVYRQEPKALAKVFVDFLYSKAGKKIITDFGAVPIDR